MKKFISNIFIAVCAFFIAGCQKTVETVVAPYLDVVPETYSESALGEGDAFLLSIRSNVAWELSAVDASGNPINWIKFDMTKGEGDADVLGFVLRGDRETDRTCTIILSTAETKLEKRLSMQQGIFVPVMLKMSFADLLNAANDLAAGETTSLTDFGQFRAEVVAVPGANLSEGYAYITDDGFYFVRIKTPQAPQLKVGDKLLLEMTEGTITKDANGGLTADLPAEIVVEGSGESSFEPAFISADAIARYENALVAVGYAQAVESNVGKPWSGDIQMTTDQVMGGTTFTVHIEDGASFSGSVPASSGQVVGIVKDGKVCPRSAEDLAGLTEERKPAYVAPHQIKTVGAFLKIKAKNAYANGTISGNTKFTFTEEPDFSVAGAAFEKVGGTANKMSAVVATGTPFQSCMTTVQWNVANSHLVYTLPVTQKLYGDLEFAFSISCSKDGFFTGDWTVQWGTDKATWKDVDAVYCTSKTTPEAAAGNTFTLSQTAYQRNRHVAEFSISESDAIESGNIYFKITPPAKRGTSATQTLRVNCGFMLTNKLVNTPDYGFDNVVAFENFDRVIYGFNPVVGFPLYYLAYHEGQPGYSSNKGWAVSGSSMTHRGCLHLSSASGANYMISPLLDMLKAPTDLTLTFKVAASWLVATNGSSHTVNALNIGVKAVGSGEVGEIVWDTPLDTAPYEWHTATVKIKGASSDTQLNIGVLDGAAKNSKFYIDDIMIVR